MLILFCDNEEITRVVDWSGIARYVYPHTSVQEYISKNGYVFNTFIKRWSKCDMTPVLPADVPKELLVMCLLLGVPIRSTNMTNKLADYYVFHDGKLIKTTDNWYDCLGIVGSFVVSTRISGKHQFYQVRLKSAFTPNLALLTKEEAPAWLLLLFIVMGIPYDK